MGSRSHCGTSRPIITFLNLVMCLRSFLFFLTLGIRVYEKELDCIVYGVGGKRKGSLVYLLVCFRDRFVRSTQGGGRPNDDPKHCELNVRVVEKSSYERF